MAVNATNQLPQEPPPPTDFQVQDFIINSGENGNPLTGSEWSSEGAAQAEGIMDSLTNFGWNDHDQNYFGSISQWGDRFEKWGDTSESFNNWANTNILSSEPFILDFLSGYTGFQVNENQGELGVSGHWERLVSAYRGWTGSSESWYGNPNPSFGEGLFAEDTPSLETMESDKNMINQWWEGLNQQMMQSSGQYAPDYWSDYFSITDEDLVMSAEEMMEAFQNEDWFTLYGPWLADLGISIEDWMAEYGDYMTPPDAQILSNIEETGASLKEEAYVGVGQKLDAERMNMVKTGFQTSYQSTDNVNAIMSDFDNLMTSIDNQTQSGIQQYAEEFYNDWLSLNMSLAQDGAFGDLDIEEEVVEEELPWINPCDISPGLPGCPSGPFDPNDPTTVYDEELAWAMFCADPPPGYEEYCDG